MVMSFMEDPLVHPFKVHKNLQIICKHLYFLTASFTLEWSFLQCEKMLQNQGQIKLKLIVIIVINYLGSDVFGNPILNKKSYKISHPP